MGSNFLSTTCRYFKQLAQSNMFSYQYCQSCLIQHEKLSINVLKLPKFLHKNVLNLSQKRNIKHLLSKLYLYYCWQKLILEEKYCKSYMIKFFYSKGDKIVFALLAKFMVGQVIIIFINIGKTCLEKMFIKAFYSRKSGFYYHSNNVLYILIYINPCRSFGACKSCC